MKQLLALLMCGLLACCGARAADGGPVPGDYRCGDALAAMALGDTEVELDDGVAWSLEVTGGTRVKVSVYSDEGYSLYDEEFSHATALLEVDGNGDPVAIAVADGTGATLLQFALRDGCWVLTVDDE